MPYCRGDNLSWMIKFSIFCAYTAQKLAQLGKKIAQARLPRLPLFACLNMRYAYMYCINIVSTGQAWKFCIFWERRSEPKKIQEPKKTKKKEMKRGERERKEKRGERE